MTMHSNSSSPLSIAKEALTESIHIRQTILSNPIFLSALEQTTMLLRKTVASGGTVYCCGNGGSACDAMHFNEELVARYKRERPGIKSMHFGDPGIVTCWGNDYDFDSIYARQVETFCTEKDILFLISTSGNSKNILAAADAAHKKNVPTIGLTGKDGGTLAGACTVSLIVPSAETARIQEVHITLIHIFCESLES